MRPLLPFILATFSVCLACFAQTPTIRFESTQFDPCCGGLRITITAKENIGLLAIGVLRDGTTDSTSKVRYLFLDANTNAIVPVAGQLVFAPGERRQLITVPVLDNATADRFRVQAGGVILHDIEGAAFPDDELLPGETIRELQLLVLITDNEFWRFEAGTPPAEFFLLAPSELLTSKTAELSLRRLGDSSQVLTVNFATADQTAKAGVHYVAQASVVTFAPLETEKTLTVPLLPGPVTGREAALELVLSGVEAGKAWTNRTTLRLVDGTRPGTVDPTFDAGELTGVLPAVCCYTHIEDLALLSDGRIYIGGHLYSVQGIPRDGIARLLPDGRLDPAFAEHTSKFSFGGDIHRLHLLPDGGLLAGYNRTRRFLPDGTGDASWDTDTDVLTVLPGGASLAVPRESPNKLLRLNPDGSLDPSFKAAVNWLWLGGPVLVDPDGKILLPAKLGTNQTVRLVRLLPEGALDPSFEIPAVGEGYPLALARQPDGRYLVAAADDQTVPKLVRLNPDGTLDPSFTIAADLLLPGAFLIQDDVIRALAVQPDGKILVGGRFRNPRSSSHGGLMRLNADGSLDPSFEVGTGAQTVRPGPRIAEPGFVNRIVLQPDGQILVSGDFTEFDGFHRAYMVRLRGDSPLLRLGTPMLGSDGTLSLPVSPGGRPLASIEIQIATRLSPPDWQPLVGQWAVVDAVDIHRSAASSASGYYRAVTR